MLHGHQDRQVLHPVTDDVGEAPRIDVSRSSAPLSARVAQRLSMPAEMAGGIVHDFRNVLSVIDSGLRLAESNFGDPDKVHTFISGAREGIARGLELTSRLLYFVPQSETEPRAADVNSLLTTLAPFLRYGAGPSVYVSLALSPAIPKCIVEPSQFAAALLTLIVNAREAMLGSAAEVRLCTAPFHFSPAISEPGLDGRYVRVRVQVNRLGVPDPVARTVFEPFFTTKEGNGTGIPQVRAFMYHIGGHITVISEPGRGTTVDLFFPAIAPDNRLTGADCPAAQPVDSSPPQAM